MAKVFYCRDIGMQCDFIARGDDEQDILRQAREHGRTVHGMQEISPDIELKVRENIREEKERKVA